MNKLRINITNLQVEKLTIPSNKVKVHGGEDAHVEFKIGESLDVLMPKEDAAFVENRTCPDLGGYFLAAALQNNKREKCNIVAMIDSLIYM